MPWWHEHSGKAESHARIPCLCFSRTTPQTSPCDHNFIVKHNFKSIVEKAFTFQDLALFRVSQVPFEKRQLGKATDFPGEPVSASAGSADVLCGSGKLPENGQSLHPNPLYDQN